MAVTVAAQLRARAADDRPGLRCAGDARTWTWREHVQECATRAAWMAGTRRERPSGRPLHVGILLDNVPELLFLLGGAALSGSVLVALNPTRGAAELAGDAARADCDLIVTESTHADLAARTAAEIGLSGPEAEAAAMPVLDIESDDHRRRLAPYAGAPLPEDGDIAAGTLLMLIFTSGTSGRPRAVRITHRKVTVPGEHLAGRLLTRDDVVYCPMPLFHSGAIMAAYAPALAAGACLVLRRGFSASGLLADVRRHDCTYAHYVGKALSYVLSTPERPDDRDNPLRVAFGNEAAPMEQEAFAERFGCSVVDGYGSTETAISLSPDPLGPPGALGRLTDGIKVLDPRTGTECPPARLGDGGRVLNGDAAIGELVNTRGLGLFDGYYNEDAEDRLRDGMFWSGDHAYADENGYVFFAGRSVDRLRVDGENFGGVQVERALAALPGVRRLAVYGVPDVAAGDQVMAAVVGDFDPDAFVAYVRGRADLSPKWIPRYIRVATALPMTASNKILKRRLAETRWHTGDPVWWRPGRELAYRRMTPADAARLRTEFERRGRLHLLTGPSPDGGRTPSPPERGGSVDSAVSDVTTSPDSPGRRMSFDLDEDQRELRGLAADLLGREAAGERLEAHEKSGAAYDLGTWRSLARAGVLGACLPEAVGGAGLGAVELAVVLREIGAHVAPVPAFAALALAAMPIARHGTPGQRALLAPLAEGETVLTGAVREPGAGSVATTARRDGDSYVLDGVKTFVPYAGVASYILVPARTDVGVGVFLVEPAAVALSPHPAATGEPMSRVALDGVRVGAEALLGGPDAAAADGAAHRTMTRFARAGAVATVSGVIEGALKLTTEYVKTREQFGRTLAQFQAVTMQIGDAYIAKRALDVATWAGVWRLDELPDEADEVLAIASYNACGPVLQALYTCQHLHGGIGLDVTYPLHRFFAWGKHYGHLLGGAEEQLDTIGDLVATQVGFEPNDQA